MSEELKWIVEGPINQPFSFDSYVINGRRFNTKSLDDRRANQNSGITIVAGTMQFSGAKDKNPILSKVMHFSTVSLPF